MLIQAKNKTGTISIVQELAYYQHHINIMEMRIAAAIAKSKPVPPAMTEILTELKSISNLISNDSTRSLPTVSTGTGS